MIQPIVTRNAPEHFEDFPPDVRPLVYHLRELERENARLQALLADPTGRQFNALLVDENRILSDWNRRYFEMIYCQPKAK